MEYNRKNLQKIFILVACCILLYIGLQNMDIIFNFLNWALYVLLPFIVAGCCTFFLNVPLKFIEKHLFRSKNGKPVSDFKEKARRPVAIFLSIGFFVVIIGVFLTIIIPEIGKSLSTLSAAIPGSINQLQEWLNSIGEENEQIKEFISNMQIDWTVISNTLVNFLQNDAANFFGSVMGMLTSIVSVVINVLLGIILSVYILMRKERLSSDAKKIMYAILPLKTADYIVDVGKLANKSFYNCITGQMTECVILGSLTVLGMTIFGFPYAALVGVLVAIMSWIPMFGVSIGIAIGALFILTESPMQALWFVVFMVCLQQIEGNFIYPRVVGSTIGLPPIFVISAIIVFSNFFGIVGLLVSVPVTSIIYTMVKRFVYVRLKQREIPKEKYELKKLTIENKSGSVGTSGKQKDNPSKRVNIFASKKKK